MRHIHQHRTQKELSLAAAANRAAEAIGSATLLPPTPANDAATQPLSLHPLFLSCAALRRALLLCWVLTAQIALLVRLDTRREQPAFGALPLPNPYTSKLWISNDNDGSSDSTKEAEAADAEAVTPSSSSAKGKQQHAPQRGRGTGQGRVTGQQPVPQQQRQQGQQQGQVRGKLAAVKVLKSVESARRDATIQVRNLNTLPCLALPCLLNTARRRTDLSIAALSSRVIGTQRKPALVYDIEAEEAAAEASGAAAAAAATAAAAAAAAVAAIGRVSS